MRWQREFERPSSSKTLDVPPRRAALKCSNHGIFGQSMIHKESEQLGEIAGLWDGRNIGDNLRCPKRGRQGPGDPQNGWIQCARFHQEAPHLGPSVGRQECVQISIIVRPERLRARPSQGSAQSIRHVAKSHLQHRIVSRVGQQGCFLGTRKGLWPVGGQECCCNLPALIGRAQKLTGKTRLNRVEVENGFEKPASDRGDWQGSLLT